jgi:hypothetical protein
MKIPQDAHIDNVFFCQNPHRFSRNATSTEKKVTSWRLSVWSIGAPSFASSCVQVPHCKPTFVACDGGGGGMQCDAVAWFSHPQLLVWDPAVRSNTTTGNNQIKHVKRDWPPSGANFQAVHFAAFHCILPTRHSWMRMCGPKKQRWRSANDEYWLHWIGTKFITTPSVLPVALSFFIWVHIGPNYRKMNLFSIDLKYALGALQPGFWESSNLPACPRTPGGNAFIACTGHMLQWKIKSAIWQCLCTWMQI